MTDWHRLLRDRLAGLQIRPEREAEILDELSQHLDDHVNDLVSGGMPTEDARVAALSDLDAPGVLEGQLSEIEARPPLMLPAVGAPVRGRWLHALAQDVRHSVRSLRRSPVFAMTAIFTLALSIGSATAILSIGNWLLWRPTPGVHDPDRVAQALTGVWTDKGHRVTVAISQLNLNDLRDASTTLAGIAGVLSTNVHLAGDALPPAEAAAEAVSFDTLSLLGVPIVAGRAFHQDDDKDPAGVPVVVISAEVAARGFGTPEGAIGQRLRVNGRPTTIIGVVGGMFSGTTPLSLAKIWYPGSSYGYINHFTATGSLTARGGGLYRTLVVRLKPEITLEAAQAELDVLVPALADRYPGVNDGFRTVRAKLGPLNTDTRARYETTVNVLLAIGAALVLLGCANVANLLMMRTVKTGRDRAVRLSLGASRARLVSMQFVESALLSLAGAAAGVLLALWLKELIVWLLFPGMPPGFDIDAPLDGRVLIMTLAVSVATGLFSGFFPAMTGRRASASLVAATAGTRSVTAARWLRSSLAAAQLALSLALVTGSLLLATTLKQLYAMDLGFDPADTSRHIVDPTRHGYKLGQSAPYFVDLLRRLEQRPGLDAVAVSTQAPFGASFLVRVEDPAGADRPPIRVMSNSVSARYFDALKMRFLRGGPFTDGGSVSSASSRYSVVIDEGLAKRLFGDADPLNRALIVPAAGDSPRRELTVAGVTASTRENQFAVDRPLFLYQPFGAEPRPSSMVIVRSQLPLAEVTRLVQEAAREIDPSLPVRLSQPISSLIASKLTNQRVFAWMLTLVGACAFVLAAVGLYGLLAQSVTERTRELGIRLAMGSGQARIFSLVLKQAGWIAASGTVAGLLLAAFGTRLIEAQLYGVTRLDPATYLLASLALAVVVFVAALWPARTATRIEPVQALRME